MYKLKFYQLKGQVSEKKTKSGREGSGEELKRSCPKIKKV